MTTTVTGSGTVVTKMVSTGTNLIIPQNQTTSLLQSATVSITGSSTLVLFLGRVATTNDDSCQVSITVDGTEVYNDAAGMQIIMRLPLTVGSHTVKFEAFGLANDITAYAFGLTAIDLGL